MSMERPRAAVVPAEAGDHLVEDRTARRGRGTASSATRRKPGAGGVLRLGFEHDRGNLPGVCVEQRLELARSL